MQWTGEREFDRVSQIFRHLPRMNVAFYDKNPGPSVLRVTTTVDDCEPE